VQPCAILLVERRRHLKKENDKEETSS